MRLAATHGMTLVVSDTGTLDARALDRTRPKRRRVAQRLGALPHPCVAARRTAVTGSSRCCD
jgi:hypothetical protein